MEFINYMSTYLKLVKDRRNPDTFVELNSQELEKVEVYKKLRSPKRYGSLLEYFDALEIYDFESIKIVANKLWISEEDLQAHYESKIPK